MPQPMTQAQVCAHTSGLISSAIPACQPSSCQPLMVSKWVWLVLVGSGGCCPLADLRRFEMPNLRVKDVHPLFRSDTSIALDIKTTFFEPKRIAIFSNLF
jgi:hypothetical protein